jgi:hypothetical protein
MIYGCGQRIHNICNNKLFWYTLHTMGLVQEALGVFRSLVLDEPKILYTKLTRTTSSPDFQQFRANPVTATSSVQINREDQYDNLSRFSLPELNLSPERMVESKQHQEAVEIVEKHLLNIDPSPSLNQAIGQLAIFLQQGVVAKDELPIIAKKYIELRKDPKIGPLYDREVALKAVEDVHLRNTEDPIPVSLSAQADIFNNK